MKKTLIAIAALAAALVGCTQLGEDQIVVNNDKILGEPFYGYIDDETRTLIDSENKINWEADDLITIFNESDHNLQYKVVLEDGAETARGAKFDYTEEYVEGSGAEFDSNYAIFPYGEANTISGSVLSFPLHALVSGAADKADNIPLVATSATHDFYFKMPTAVMRIKVSKEKNPNKFILKTITISSRKGQKLAGTANVDMAAEVPIATIVDDENASSSITLDLGEGLVLTTEQQYVYFAVPAMTFETDDLAISFTATVSHDEKFGTVNKAPSIAFEAGKLKQTSLLITSDSFSGSTEDMTAVAAIGSVQYSTLEEAFKAAAALGSEQVTISMLAPAVLKEQIEVPAESNISLLLNGHEVSQTAACTAHYAMIVNRGTLSIVGEGKVSFTDNGAGDPAMGWGSYTIENRGTLVIDGPTVENLTSLNANGVVHMYCAIQQATGSTTVKSGTISTPTYRSLRANGGSVNILDGVFEGQIWMQPFAEGSSLTIENGVFAPRGVDGSSVFVTNDSKEVAVSIKGGYFQTKVGCSVATKEGVANAIVGGYFTEAAKTEGATTNMLAEDYYWTPSSKADYPFTLLNMAPTAEGDYEIENYAELCWLAEQVNSGNNFAGKTLKLVADIDLENQPWTPIGFNEAGETTGSENHFAGVFDGQGKTISNLFFENDNAGGVGLFGAVHNATFKNLTLENVNIKAVDADATSHISGSASGNGEYIVGGHIGAVAGYDMKAGTIVFDNVHVKGLIKIEGEPNWKQGQRVGGVFGGKADSNVSFNNVTVKGDAGSYIKGYCNVAGVMGQNNHKGTFTDVHAEGLEISGYSFGVGGIVGLSAVSSVFENCSSTNNVIKRNQPLAQTSNSLYRVGAIVGCWAGANKAHTITLTDCESNNNTLISATAEGVAAPVLDYRGMVGRAYQYGDATLGSTVTIDDQKFVDEGSCVYSVDGIYEISNLIGLKWLANEVNANSNTFAKKTVKLIGDIDLGSEEWTPIGNSTVSFQGTFDGNNKTVSNLVINAEGKSNIGLFGMTTNGEVKNLTVNNANVKGRLNVAVVAGTPYTSKYNNIKVTGLVQVDGLSYVGGVGGKNAYASWKDITVDVEAGSYVHANSVENGTAYRTYVGGVCGFMGEGSHSFTNVTSNIDVKGSTIDIGGLVGIAHEGNSFINCHVSGNVEVYGASSVAGAEEIGGLAGVWMNGATYRPVTFTGCSFTGTLEANQAADLTDNTITGNGYYYTGNEGSGYRDIDGTKYYFLADGVWKNITNAADVVYELKHKDALYWFANKVNVDHYRFAGETVKLMNDVNLNGEAWTPIGLESYNNNFIGTFDGNGKTVSNFTCDDDTAAGFFGRTSGGAYIKNLTVDNATITSRHYAGGIFAWAEAGAKINTIDNCHVLNSTITSTVVNNDNGDKVGGIIGWMYYGDVKNCSVKNTHLSGYRDMGGIMGYTKGGNITDNSIEGVTINVDNSVNYKNYGAQKQYNVGSIIGRIDAAPSTEANNTGVATINWNGILANGSGFGAEVEGDDLDW